MAKTIKNYKIVDRLIPRDALKGGRTEVFIHHATCDGLTSQIHYSDVISLYPSTQLFGEYPIGHPTIQTEGWVNGQRIFGLIKCTILPPQNLHIPVLPASINGKLVFSLCFQCAFDMNQGICKHSEKERAFMGTWVSLEVDKAIEKGYRILELHETWHWSNTDKYDPQTKTGGLFTSYVTTCMARKIENSGFPAHVETQQDKELYVQDVFDHQGIKIDIAKVQNNPGKRAVSKLENNSHWGKLAERPNKPQFKFVHTRAELLDMLNDDRFIVNDVDFSHPNIVQVFYNDNEELESPQENTNVVLAAFVTSQARLKLYEALDQLGERLIYCDTDSCIFKWSEGQYKPPLGDKLGEYTNEIDPKDGTYIKTAVCIAPKTYTLEYDSGKVKIVCKGITLHSAASKALTNEKIKAILLDEEKRKNESIKVPQLVFIRNKIKQLIRTEERDKVFRYTSGDKRVLKDDFSTRPFGFTI